VEFTQQTTVVLDFKLQLGTYATVNADDFPVMFFVENNLQLSNGTTFNGNVYAKGNILGNGLPLSRTQMRGTFASLAGIFANRYVDFTTASHCFIGEDSPPSCLSDFTEDGADLSTRESHNIEQQISLKVSPNPAISQVNLKLEGMTADYQIALVDMMGRMVWQAEKKYDNDNFDLDLTALNLTDGMYLIHVRMGDEMMVEKLYVVK